VYFNFPPVNSFHHCPVVLRTAVLRRLIPPQNNNTLWAARRHLLPPQSSHRTYNSETILIFDFKQRILLICFMFTITMSFFSSYYASASFPPGPPRLVPPLKRPRLMVPPARPVIKTTIPQKPQPTAINQLKTYSKYSLSVLRASLS
jgi:hypothetical protein